MGVWWGRVGWGGDSGSGGRVVLWCGGVGRSGSSGVGLGYVVGRGGSHGIQCAGGLGGQMVSSLHEKLFQLVALRATGIPHLVA